MDLACSKAAGTVFAEVISSSSSSSRDMEVAMGILSFPARTW